MKSAGFERAGLACHSCGILSRRLLSKLGGTSKRSGEEGKEDRLVQHRHLLHG